MIYDSAVFHQSLCASIFYTLSFHERGQLITPEREKVKLNFTDKLVKF